MSYKSIEDIVQIKAERRDRIRQESQQEDSSNGDQAVDAFKESTFNLSSFLTLHPDSTCENLTNFTSEELDELVEVINNKLGTGHRGKKTRVSTKGCLFLTLMYYSTYVPLQTLSGIVSVQIPTLERIIRKVTSTYFPVFIDKFIPKALPTCRVQFKNYPDAVGAVDSSTIPFFRPQAKDDQKKSWDAKNHQNGIKLQALVNPAGKAIHICTNFLGATHDKKVFDLSGATAFVTVKRGVEDVQLPILADRGYIGIEKYHTTAIVQQKGSSKAVKDRNNYIAVDRQIVERFFGRFKVSWGAMSDGYRGDRDNIGLIIMGLVALTNYYIDLHPLTSTDDNELGKSFEYPEEESKCEADKSIMIKRKTSPSYSLEPTDMFVGIHNLGTTCHIDAIVQVLFIIKPLIKSMPDFDLSKSPIKELWDIFSAMQDHIDNRGQSTYVISPEVFITALGHKWFSAQDADDTFNQIVTTISKESTGPGNIINDLFQIKTSWNVKITDESGEKITKVQSMNSMTYSTLINYNGVMESLAAQKSKLVTLTTSPIFVLNIQRPSENVKFKAYMKSFTFPMHLNLSNISDGPYKKYDLFAIIAYAEFHFISFERIGMQWYVFDDENVYKCNDEHIMCLVGGEQQNILWEHTKPRKWTAKMLFYKEEHFDLFT